VKPRHLILAPVLLSAMATSAQPRGEPLVLRVKSDDGRIEFFHHGKRLTEPTIQRLCATAKSQKADIEFERDRMTGNDAMAAILKEADCLGAKSAAGHPETKAAARMHARHTKGKPR